MKKRYLIMLIIAIVLIIALGAGFAFAYFFTDIFRSNKELFSKYISQNLEIVDIFKDEDVKAYSEKQKNTAYTSEGTIKTNVTFPDSSEAKVASALQNCNITFTGKTDNLSKYMHQTIKANYSDTQSMQFDLYRSGDIYAAKINEVLVKYIGLDNNNLKEFATKIQLPEEITSKLPNKIELNSLASISGVFSDEEKSALKEKYLKIITENLTDDMFSKESISDETIFILKINEDQFKNIIAKLLETLKEDETLINKLKETLINNYNFTEDEIQTYITQYKEFIQQTIDRINSNSDTNILERANKARALTDQKQIEERIQLTYLGLLSKNNRNVERADLQTALEEEFGLGKVTDLAEDFSTVKIDGKEYSITGNSTINQNSENENNTDISDEDQNTENNTNSSNNIIIKVYANKGKLSKTEIILNDIFDFVVSKSDDGAKFELINNGVATISAFMQKLKSPNETKFEFAFSQNNSQIFDLTIGFSGLDTDSVHENSELTFDIDLGNSTITNAKTKFVSTYKNTKTFGAIQKDEINNSEILLLNTAPSMKNIENLFNNIANRTTQLNNSKLKALGLTEEQNPFMYYVPSVVPFGATYIMQNPDKGPYFVVPSLIMTGVSVSMLSADNSILTKAAEASANTAISTVKEQIQLEQLSLSAQSNGNNELFYSLVEKMLKNFNPNNENIEYSYNNGNITIKSKKDPTKIITGTLSKDGNINWN